MSLKKNFISALKDGLGSKAAKGFELEIIDEENGVGVAFSWENGVMYYLLFGHDERKSISASRYLDLAKMLSTRYHCFVAPNQKVGPIVAWGRVAGRQVSVYRFKVLNVPKNVWL